MNSSSVLSSLNSLRLSKHLVRFNEENSEGCEWKQRLTVCVCVVNIYFKKKLFVHDRANV